MAWKASHMDVKDRTQKWLGRNSKGIFNFDIVDESKALVFNTVKDAKLAAEACSAGKGFHIKYREC